MESVHEEARRAISQLRSASDPVLVAQADSYSALKKRLQKFRIGSLRNDILKRMRRPPDHDVIRRIGGHWRVRNGPVDPAEN